MQVIVDTLHGKILVDRGGSGTLWISVWPISDAAISIPDESINDFINALKEVTKK